MANFSSKTAATESFFWDDGRLKSASFDATQGFGLRVVAGERAGYGHASVLETDAIEARGRSRCCGKARPSRATLDVSPAKVNRQLYANFDPIESPTLHRQNRTVGRDRRLLPCASDPRVVQVSATLAGGRRYRGLTILRPDGAKLTDHRPLVRINVSVTVERDGRRESGSAGAGGREPYEDLHRARSLESDWPMKRLRIALVNLDAIPAPDWRDGCGAWALVGRACCCTKQLATALKATSTAKARAAFSGMVGDSASPHLVLQLWMTARSKIVAAL